MKFLEKDLETIIWENYQSCQDRGLQIASDVYEQGKRYRQMNLMPFGIADLVNVFYNAIAGNCWVQIIECKKTQVDVNTYLQAKRYGTAIADVFFSLNLAQVRPIISYVLIGAELNTNSELAHVISQDNSCQTFTYKYGVDGIRFEDVTAHWGYATSSIGCERTVAERPELEKYLLDTQFGLYKQRKANGHESSPLLVTASGILLNTSLLDHDSYGAAD